MRSYTGKLLDERKKIFNYKSAYIVLVNSSVTEPIFYRLRPAFRLPDSAVGAKVRGKGRREIATLNSVYAVMY